MIERPYSTPDDIARSTFGATGSVTQAESTDPNFVLTNENDTQALPFLNFEWGLSDKVSWVFPLGLKWNLYSNKKHTLGISAQTLIFVTNYSLDYWYRLNSKFSLRPYFRGNHIDVIIYQETSTFGGTDLVYQASEKWALSLGGHAGTLKYSSDFLNIFINNFTDGRGAPAETRGTFWQARVGGLYSLSETWDFEFTLAFEQQELTEIKARTGTANMSFSYIW